MIKERHENKANQRQNQNCMTFENGILRNANKGKDDSFCNNSIWFKIILIPICDLKNEILYKNYLKKGGITSCDNFGDVIGVTKFK